MLLACLLQRLFIAHSKKDMNKQFFFLVEALFTV